MEMAFPWPNPVKIDSKNRNKSTTKRAFNSLDKKEANEHRDPGGGFEMSANGDGADDFIRISRTDLERLVRSEDGMQDSLMLGNFVKRAMDDPAAHELTAEMFADLERQSNGQQSAFAKELTSSAYTVFVKAEVVREIRKARFDIRRARFDITKLHENFVRTKRAIWIDLMIAVAGAGVYEMLKVAISYFS